MTETICLVLIQGQRGIMDCIMNYIALGIIADIDNLYYEINNDLTHKIVMKNGDDWQPRIVR